MKCVHCQHDCKYRERSDGRCPQCRQRFAFEPRKGDPLTDAAFAAAIERVSSRGSVRFNTDHLYYDVRRRYERRSPLAAGGCLGAALLIPAVVIMFSVSAILVPLVLVVMVLLGVAAYRWVRSNGHVPWRRLPRLEFDKLLHRYVQAHGALTGLIERRAQEGQRSNPAIDPAEMLAYSFDRAVICDRPETVDVLLANQFHFENNCAVLAINGYPPHAFETVRTMLRNNPRLVVVALHDASVSGCQLAHRLQSDSAWFKDGVPVLDVGLRPQHAKAFLGQQDRLPTARQVVAGAGIATDEAKWLARYTLSLAVVIPEQIIKRLFRAINVAEDRQDEGSRDSGSSGGDSGSYDFEFGNDADTSDGGGDSFG